MAATRLAVLARQVVNEVDCSASYHRSGISTGVLRTATVAGGRSYLTTHVLDTASGRPAGGMKVSLSRGSNNNMEAKLADRTTDKDGRVGDLVDEKPLPPGTYTISFGTAEYYKAKGQKCFYPTCIIEFVIEEGEAHYHVPLLISPYGFSTYRGS